MKKIAAAVAALVAVVLIAAACTSESQRQASENASQEQRVIAAVLKDLLDSQPIPAIPWSQERQTLNDILALRALGSTSTTMFFLEGVGMVFWCPSLGAPVPSTYEVTASQQWIRVGPEGARDNGQVDQMEPTGVYTGESAATWTLCLDDAGKKFGVYWEAPVSSVSGTMRIADAPRLRPSDVTFQFTNEGEEPFYPTVDPDAVPAEDDDTEE
jgi:hypothetical protein